ncbi:MAG TPA: PAS domain S-box protein [Bacteroidales bacterium]|nr:PAS domain S-box protein [Bacteroidales bacterium]
MPISTYKQLMLYYKLSKSIGASSDIVTMLKRSISAYQKELNCYTCAIIRLLKQANNSFITEVNFSLPYSLGITGQYEFIQKNIPEKFTEKELELFLETLPLIRRQENLVLHITSLPAFGFLVLITSNEEIARETLDVVTEINEKLAQTCHACFHIQDLEDNEFMHRKLMDQLPQVIFETDLAGNITFANHYANQIVGLTHDEAESKVNALEIFPDAEFNRAFLNFKNTLLGIEQAPAEFRIKKNTGDIFPCVVYTSSIIKNLKVTGIRVVLIDITERVKNEKIQNEYTGRLELALLGNGSGFWDWDLQTGQLYMSERFRAIIGLEKDENMVDFKSLMSIINEEDKHEINRALTDHLSGRSPYFVAEYRLKAHDNTWK